MSSTEEQIAQLHAALAAQEGMRPALGDAVVDTTVAALRAQLNHLLAQQAATSARSADGSAPAELLKRLIPEELAGKIRASGSVEGERKTVTVLFADLSGFTSLAERFDPEVIRSFQDDLFPEMAEAVYQYEGHIDKFMGDAIMAVFGAPIAHEDDPERALRAAVSMRERMARINRRWIDRLGAELNLHIGVNTGMVVAGALDPDLGYSYMVTGDTVNTASRLQSSAQPGQILVSRETYRLTHGAFQFVALEPIAVKGKREPVPVYELERARLNPLKLRGLTELGSPYVGRRAERTALDEILRDLLAGHGRIVTVAGEAGIGKSRLMAEWHEQAGAQVRWVEGRAFAHTSALAYGPFLDLFRRYAGIGDEDSEVTARARLDARVTRFFGNDPEVHALFASMMSMRLLPEQSQLMSNLRAPVFRDKLFGIIAQLFTNLARERPTLLLMEDMHWADAASLELLEHLLPLTQREPLTIVSLFRVQADEPASKSLAMIQERFAGKTTHLALSPLPENTSLLLVQQLLSLPDLPATLQKMIVEKAEGNPFFVEELVRTLIERGALIRNEHGGWTCTALIESISVPDTLRGLLMARIDRLPEEAKGVAQQASVIGRVFLYRVLQRMNEDDPGLPADLSQLERRVAIRERARDPEIEYIFKHALTQETTYESLLEPRRRELHRRVAHAMEQLFAERLSEFSGVIATHYWNSEAWEQATGYLLRAGDAAGRLYATTEARQYYNNALEALTRLPDSEANRLLRVDTTIKLAGVSIVSDDPTKNLERLAHAEALARMIPAPNGQGVGDPLRMARIHYWMGRAHFYRNESREAIGYYRQVLAEGKESGDPELLALPSNTLGQVMLLIQGQFAKATPLLTQAVGQLESLQDWSEWIRGQGYLGLALGAQGWVTEGLAHTAQALVRGRETNNQTGVGLTLLMISGVHLMARNHERLLEAVRACLETNEKTGDRLQAYIAHALDAWSESRLGRHEAARERLTQSQAIGSKLGGRLVLSDWFAVADAELAYNAGHLDDALALTQKAITFTKTVGSAFSEGMAHRVLAQTLMAGGSPDGPAIEAELDASVQLLESGAAMLEAAHTRMVYGEFCRAQGHRVVAVEHFSAAAAQFEKSGLENLLAEARDSLRQVGGDSAYGEIPR